MNRYFLINENRIVLGSFNEFSCNINKATLNGCDKNLYDFAIKTLNTNIDGLMLYCIGSRGLSYFDSCKLFYGTDSVYIRYTTKDLKYLSPVTIDDLTNKCNSYIREYKLSKLLSNET